MIFELFQGKDPTMAQLPHRIAGGSSVRPRTMGRQLAEKPQPIVGEKKTKGVVPEKPKKPRPPKPLG